MSDSLKKTQAAILGAGPAGLGAAWELAKHGIQELSLIDRHSIPGGLSRTEVFSGNRFDVGPHRFFTGNREVNALWHSVLGTDFQPVKRLTRIFYRNRYFLYPLEPRNALMNLGLRGAVGALLSFVVAQGQKHPEAKTFEEWVTARFGKRLFEAFFQTYTEKVWGISCREIGAEWASQRIKGLDLREVLVNAFFKSVRKAKTLVEEFDYPVLGAGMMYERMWERNPALHREWLPAHTVTQITRSNNRLTGVILRNARGETVRLEADHYFSSIPMTHFLQMLDPPPPPEVLAAVRALYFRDHITVNILADGGELFPDQWIYVHSPEVKMARLANYGNFSGKMPAIPGTSVISAEYFVFAGDEVWSLSDEALSDLAGQELEYMKLLPRNRIRQCWVVRETECYPTYYLGFQPSFDCAREFVQTLENCTLIGRGGMYKYNNMDHSVLTGLYAARNYVRHTQEYDLWSVNIDGEYQEGSRRESVGG
jgi:protoporphyrinogen oxidase